MQLASGYLLHLLRRVVAVRNGCSAGRLARSQIRRVLVYRKSACIGVQLKASNGVVDEVCCINEAPQSRFNNYAGRPGTGGVGGCSRNCGWRAIGADGVGGNVSRVVIGHIDVLPARIHRDGNREGIGLDRRILARVQHSGR